MRTPIATMIGICEILLDDDSLQEDHRDLVEKSLRSGEILLDLVGTVLVSILSYFNTTLFCIPDETFVSIQDMGKVEAGKLSIEKCPFFLADTLNDAALFSVPAIKKGLEFNQDIGSHYKGVLEGDRVRIRQVLSNALSNSVKFTKSGKYILILLAL